VSSRPPRVGERAAPDDALAPLGIAASEAGWPLAAYCDCGSISRPPGAADREAVQARIIKARRMLLTPRPAVTRHRVTETRPSGNSPGDRQVIRSVAAIGPRDGRGPVGVPRGRAGRGSGRRYRRGCLRGLVSRLLDSPRSSRWPPQAMDPNEPGPRTRSCWRLRRWRRARPPGASGRALRKPLRPRQNHHRILAHVFFSSGQGGRDGRGRAP